MTSPIRAARPAALPALALTLALAGCGDGGLGPGGGTGSVQLALSRTTTSALSGAVSASLASFGGNVSPEQVAAVNVTITRVDAHLAGAAEESGWVTIELAAPIVLDLLALPTDPADAIPLPKGELAVGTYTNLRLHVSDATITFTEDVTIGGGPVAKTWEAGTPHPLRIPGPPDTHVKVPMASFVVEEGETTEIDLVFDAGTSIQSIQATPLFLQMAPVLLATVDNGA